MDNASVVDRFKMTPYEGMEKHKYIYVALFLLLYLTIIYFNVQLIAIVSQRKSLHQPMNMFTCNLCVNAMYGSSALFPVTLHLAVSETHEISVTRCLLQVYFMHTYGGIEFYILAVMAYDRYVAICCPLRYHDIMTNRRTFIHIALSWLYPSLMFLSIFGLTVPLRFCKRFLDKLYCVNFEVVRNSCTATAHISMWGLVSMLFTITPQLLMIVFSYGRIFVVCSRLSKESRFKTMKTCIPHLVSIVNYSVGCFYEIIQSRFDMSQAPLEGRIFMSLFFIIIPSITNPVLYGFGIQKVRAQLVELYITKHVA